MEQSVYFFLVKTGSRGGSPNAQVGRERLASESTPVSKGKRCDIAGMNDKRQRKKLIEKLTAMILRNWKAWMVGG